MKKTDICTIASANLTTAKNITIHENKKEAKRKFSSQCGSVINGEIKQCTGCGKKNLKVLS